MTADAYKGPGKLFSTVGGWFIGGCLGGLAATAMIAAFPVTGMYWAALAVGLLGNIGGAVLGYQYAQEGERQYEAVRAQAQTRTQAAREETYSPQISEKRFTDRIQSKAANGNYADAVLAEAANATQQTR